MDISLLAKATAEHLGAAIEEDEGVFFLTVAVEDEEDEGESTEEPPNQIVVLGVEDDGETMIVSSDAGPCSDEVDMGAILRGLSSVIYARVYLGDPEADGEHLIVEAGIPLAGLQAAVLSNVVQEVAEVCDWLDELMFEDEEDSEEGEEADDEGDE